MSVAPYFNYSTKYFSKKHRLRIKEKFLKISDDITPTLTAPRR